MLMSFYNSRYRLFPRPRLISIPKTFRPSRIFFFYLLNIIDDADFDPVHPVRYEKFLHKVVLLSSSNVVTQRTGSPRTVHDSFSKLVLYLTPFMHGINLSEPLSHCCFALLIYIEEFPTNGKRRVSDTSP